MVGGAATRLFGLAGWSGSGKTTLIEKLIATFVAQGLRVSTIKHAHHSFDLDQPGKDSHRHRLAGATEVLVGSARRWALIHELRDEDEPDLDALVARMGPADLLLIEGFKRHPHAKLEIHRPSLGKPMLWPDDPDIVGVASDEPVSGLSLPRFDLADVPSIAAFVLARARSSK